MSLTPNMLSLGDSIRLVLEGIQRLTDRLCLLDAVDGWDLPSVLCES